MSPRRPVRRISPTTHDQVGDLFESVARAAEWARVPPSTLSDAIRKRKSLKGHLWQFVEEVEDRAGGGAPSQPSPLDAPGGGGPGIKVVHGLLSPPASAAARGPELHHGPSESASEAQGALAASSIGGASGAGGAGGAGGRKRSRFDPVASEFARQKRVGAGSGHSLPGSSGGSVASASQGRCIQVSIGVDIGHDGTVSLEICFDALANSFLRSHFMFVYHDDHSTIDDSTKRRTSLSHARSLSRSLAPAPARSNSFSLFPPSSRSRSPRPSLPLPLSPLTHTHRCGAGACKEIILE